MRPAAGQSTKAQGVLLTQHAYCGLAARGVLEEPSSEPTTEVFWKRFLTCFCFEIVCSKFGSREKSCLGLTCQGSHQI